MRSVLEVRGVFQEVHPLLVKRESAGAVEEVVRQQDVALEVFEDVEVAQRGFAAICAILPGNVFGNPRSPALGSVGERQGEAVMRVSVDM